jgi:hypothetical protein
MPAKISNDILAIFIVFILFSFLLGLILGLSASDTHMFTGQIDEIIPGLVSGCDNGMDFITLVRLDGTDQIHEYACVYMGEVGDIVRVYVP